MSATCYSYDEQYGEVEEITLQPIGGFKATHMEPMSHERNKVIMVNVCTNCNSVGGGSFHFIECEHCGGEVEIASKKAKWVPTLKRTVHARKWVFGKQIITHDEVGGRWVDC